MLHRIFFGVLLITAPLALGQTAPGGTASEPSKGSASEASAAPTLAQARELAGKGHLDQALTQLDTLAAAKPEQVGVERLRGIILYQKERLRTAHWNSIR